MIDTPAIEKLLLGIEQRAHDAPLATEYMLDEAATTIRALMEAVEGERERCAKIAENAYERWADMENCPVVCDVTACQEIAAAIRSKGDA